MKNKLRISGLILMTVALGFGLVYADSKDIKENKENINIKESKASQDERENKENINIKESKANNTQLQK